MKAAFHLLATAVLALILTACQPAKAETLEVYKADGTLQCEEAPGTPLETMAAELRAGGVTVIAGRQGHDGLMRIQVCGTETGNANIFEIPAEDLEDAQALGFQPFPSPGN